MEETNFIELNLASQKEFAKIEFNRRARFEALNKSPKFKIDKDGREVCVTADEQIADSEKLYQWLIAIQ